MNEEKKPEKAWSTITIQLIAIIAEILYIYFLYKGRKTDTSIQFLKSNTLLINMNIFGSIVAIIGGYGVIITDTDVKKPSKYSYILMSFGTLLVITSLILIKYA